MVTDAGPRRWPRRLAQVVLGLAAVALAVGGVVAVGHVARDAIRPNDRYLLPFADIDCPAPPGQSSGRPNGRRGSVLTRSASTRSTLNGGLAMTKSAPPTRLCLSS